MTLNDCQNVIPRSPIAELFAQLIGVLRNAPKLAQQGVQVSPVLIVLGELAMFPRKNVLLIRSVLG